MSVSLLITEQGDKSERIVPIATEEIFIRYWKPLSSALDLQWVPLFQSGFFVDHTDVPLVLAELKKVSYYLSTRHPADMPADVREHIASRVIKLISELEHSQNAVEVYIG